MQTVDDLSKESVPSVHVLDLLVRPEVETPRGPWGEPVPEAWEFLPSPRKPLGAFSRWPLRKYAVMTLLLGAFISAVSLIQWAAGLDLSASGHNVYAKGEVWRLVTALLVHGDLGHLGSNLLPFLFFGWMLQSYFGFWIFPVLALPIGIASNALTVALYDSRLHLLGASGMIYGMIALWLVLYLRFDVDRALPKRIARAVAFALLMLMPTTYDANVSHLAHASGFVAGLTGGFVVMPFVKVRDPSRRN
jgi:membrane associated rhomboid family serine protease